MYDVEHSFVEDFATQYAEKGPKRLVVSCYVDNKAPALMIFDDKTGEPIMTASVNAHTGKPAEGCILIKDWSENAGIEYELETLGLIEPTGKIFPCGYEVASEHRMKGKLLEAWNKLKEVHPEYWGK